MSIIAQKQLFVWKDIEELGDLERLFLVLKILPDTELIEILIKERANGRNKYPVEPVWNSIIAGIIYQHNGIESLRRELLRNGQLRELCGFEVAAGINAVPPSYIYSRFLKKIIKHEDEIKKMFDKLVEMLKEELADFGKILAIDGKAIPSVANGKNKKKEQDGRRDIDADWGKKEYKGQDKEGKAWKKVISWFGYKLHLIIDAQYELPVEYKVTKASIAEQPVAEEMLKEMGETKKEIIERCNYLTGDRGYDTLSLNTKPYEDYNIKTVIDIRNLWKDGEETKLIPGQENIVYNFKGDVFCVCLATGEQREMAYGGFEKDRGTLKYNCPVYAYGITCKGCKKCPVKKSIRINIDIDRRVFTPVARSSYTWDRIYAKRTSVERVNSRLDMSFGFEQHYIRGLKKMEVRCGLALCIMLALAYGRIIEKRKSMMRSLVKSCTEQKCKNPWDAATAS